MRRRLTKVGNSWGLLIPRDVLDLLGLEGGVQLAGNTLSVTAPDLDARDIDGGLAYVASGRERAIVYRRLAE